MLWIIIETAADLIFGSSESRTWKRGRLHRFRKHFGVEYHTVLGRDVQDYLSTIHGVPESWTWHTSIESVDKEKKRFTVKFDDGCGQSGTIDIHFSGSSPSYRLHPEPSEARNAEKPLGD